MHSSQNINQLAGHLFRHEAGRMAAVLARLLGSDRLQVAEDIVQDTLVKAMETWRFNGVPENPSAWLYAVAKNKALDFIRSRQRHEKINSEIAKAVHSDWALPASVNQLFLQHEIEDSLLRMIFATCHPSIPEESQIALTLKILCGLSVKEIASAFLTNEEAIQKRITRAKEKLREEKINLEVPAPRHLPDRLDAVLKVIYLLFNEGYHPSQSAEEIHEDLCEEAMRLANLLTQNPVTSQPRVLALLALMCLQASRFDSRRSAEGLITLEQQDRSRWNRKLMEQGFTFLELASVGNDLSEYHVEAAIASVHMKAPSFEQTNWKQLVSLYDLLQRLKPGPVVELNRAIALGYGQSYQEGIDALESINGLDSNHFYYAAIGNFYLQMGKPRQAADAYQKALATAQSKVDRDFLEKKIQSTSVS